jgi:hypothetical protein
MISEPAERDEPVPPELLRAATTLGATSAGRAPRKPAGMVADVTTSTEEAVGAATDAGPAPNPAEPPVEGS